MKEIWRLNPKEVHFYGGSSNASKRKNARQQRIIDVRTAEINLVHSPTKIEVKGTIPAGNYSKKEMVRLTEALRGALFLELENKVAKFLKIPKR